MKRVVFSVMVALFGFTVHADQGEPSLYKVFSAFAGRWASTSGLIELNYIVSEDGVRLEGESCRPGATAQAPESCRPINEEYHIERSRLLHDYPNFGAKPVDIVELSDFKIVRMEQNPVLADRSQTITEERDADGDTLRVTVEQRVNGRRDSKRHQEILLHRVAP